MAETVKLVILELEGNCRIEMVQVRLEIGPEDARPTIKAKGALPPNPVLVETLQKWRDRYHSLDQVNRAIKPEMILYDGSVYLDDCRRTAKELERHFQAWLETPGFREINEHLREELGRQDLIRILIRAEYRELQWLPWHSWSFIDRYHRAEVGLSSLSLQPLPVRSRRNGQTVRILAVLGDSSGIETQADSRLLETLPGAEVKLLLQPKRHQINEQLWDQPWDILFFAGHSQTEDGEGRIYINTEESLSIEELRYGVRRAIVNGLQLAIFNSCDGLGLAYELDGEGLPYMIVMREPIPDPVAQSFLKGFLNAFSQGQSLLEATREGRERLQGMENDYPCASWLPIIYQNSSTPMLYWRTLQNKVNTARKEKSLSQTAIIPTGTSSQKRYKTLRISIALVVTFCIVTIRMLGFFQPLELRAYDHFISLRSGLIQSNNRAFAILIDEEDIKYQRKLGIKGEGSLSDEALMRVLNAIEPYHPRAIGLDIIHDFPFQKNLKDYLKQHDNFFGICEIGAAEYGISDTEPPINLSSSQVGFMSFPLDRENFIRRQFLGMTPGDSCKAEHSLNFKMTLKYLEGESHDPSLPLYSFRNDNLLEIRLGQHSKLYESIERNSGGYRLPKAADRGFQTLISYSQKDIPHRQLREILELGNFEKDELKNLVQNKMIFIGVDIPTIDQYKTPLNSSLNSTTPGVIIHAQMASSILETTLDDLSPIGWWPELAENIWIFLWSIIGVSVLSLRASKAIRFTVLTILVLGLYGICLYTLVNGLWIPSVPALLGLVTSYLCSVKFAVKR